jgi:hyperosmotically inducible protein
MILKPITVFAICALALVGCNRPTTDQGGTSTESATGTRHERAAPSATVPTPSTPSADITTKPDQSATKPADNTGRNVRDRSDAAVTPGDQSEAKADVELTRQIRAAINQNDQLSTMAKNIKIITAGGKVTLRGPVKSSAEEQQIVEKVKATPGVTSVENQLEIKNNP